MTRSVIITTPIPTWEETVERYGLSKADQKFVIRLVEEKTSRSPISDARASRRGAVHEFRSASANTSRSVARKVGNSARKKTNRARASA